MSLGDYWSELVTVALLGTDRRDPPPPPDGGLADLAADDPQPNASQRLLQQAAACTVVRRAGLLPGPPLASVAPAAADDRPLTPVAATATWRKVVADWPVLEDEWMLAVIASGRRLSPELVPSALARHRTDPVRHARVMVAAGPLGQWLADWSPRLACTARTPTGLEHAVASLPELPLVPELQALLHATPDAVAAALQAGFDSAAFTAGHRGVLVNFIARVAHNALSAAVRATSRIDPTSPSIGLAYALSDLAALRHHMLAELETA